ncbi:MAG: hypothetical protein EOP47_07950 [Sphingobacteriaceae bacterium]|nr:MAG: hypothetical protein EOP47_07950 [Sphingobacteriaceae bacterium]
MLLLCMVCPIAYAQSIQGQILNADDGKPLDDVFIQNLYTDASTTCDDNGRFTIEVTKGQLVEFKKEGFRVLRVRIPQGNLPSFFKVVLEQTLPSPSEIAGMSPDYRSDSLKYYRMYKRELDFPQMKGMDAIQHPFWALSKQNQQIWAFQKEYAWYQKQKFIDYNFNDKVIENLTGLKGDSAMQYMQMFRPTYEMIRSMTEYNFYNYIKNTVTLYRERGIRARMGRSRGTH